MKKHGVVLLLAQGAYYLITGLWPLLHLKSFIVTGPKNDIWLVKTLGLLIGCIGLALLAASSENNNVRSISVLAVTSACALLFVDVFYPLKGVISKVYMVDGAVQLGCIGIWLYLLMRKTSTKGFSIFRL